MWNQYFSCIAKSQIRETTISLQAMLSQGQSGLAVRFAPERLAGRRHRPAALLPARQAPWHSLPKKESTIPWVKRAIAHGTPGSNTEMPTVPDAVLASLRKTQNAKLDQAAQNHATYLAVNDIRSHFELSGRTGFTGVEPGARWPCSDKARPG